MFISYRDKWLLSIFVFVLRDQTSDHFFRWYENDNDNENKFIAKVVQRKALQNAVHGIHIKTEKQEKNILKDQLWQRGQK